MSGGWSSYQENNDLELKIIVRYEGLKATQYFSKFTSASDTVLREDLVTLKLPHPKRENTTFISYGCVECVWPLVRKNGALHKQITTRTRPHNPEERKALGTLLQKLSISNLVAKEIYPDGGKGKNLKRPNPFTNRGAVEGSSAGPPRSEGNRAQLMRLLPTEKHPKQLGSTAPKITEAETFLRDVGDSRRPYKIPKLEPSDPSSIRQVLSLGPRSTTPISSHSSSASKATNPPESISSSSPFVNHKPPRAKPPVSNVPPSLAGHAFPLLPKPPSATAPDLSNSAATSAMPDLGKISMPAPLPDPIQEMLRELRPLLSVSRSLPESAQRQMAVPEAKTTPIPSPKRSLEATSSRPKASDIPKIQRLSRESCDIRRNITADTVRDADIISELKQLNATFIPRPLKVGVIDAATGERIRKLEQDLDAERRMRLEAEDVIRDIKRECKAPFVVPGLLDAFVKLSRLTTQATRLNGTVAKDNG